MRALWWTLVEWRPGGVPFLLEGERQTRQVSFWMREC